MLESLFHLLNIGICLKIKTDNLGNIHYNASHFCKVYISSMKISKCVRCMHTSLSVQDILLYFYELLDYKLVYSLNLQGTPSTFYIHIQLFKTFILFPKFEGKIRTLNHYLRVTYRKTSVCSITTELKARNILKIFYHLQTSESLLNILTPLLSNSYSL